MRNSALAAIIVWSAAACSFDEEPGSGVCVQGQQAVCSCPGGAVGVRTCGASSEFGSCLCGGPSVVGAPAGSSGDGAPPSAAGTSAPMPGAAGTSATQVDDGASGQGSDAEAGSGADGGDGADAAAADAGAGEGGSDSAGSGGAGGGGAGGAGGGGDSEPRPGSPYSHCSSDQPCDEGLVCAPTGSSNGNGSVDGYCTAFCDANTGGACPQPESGTVVAICFPFASVCALIDCQDAQCPDGMRCVQASSSGSGNPWGGSGSLFTCAYAARE